MGTHNRIFNISSPGHPRAYLEIIAINSVATSALPAGARRWFDMDDATLQQQVAQHGPQLIHWVASVPEVAASHAALAAQDIERGTIITASRPTPNGLLQWQITVREDGLRLMDGCLPTLIQWGAVHPCGSLPASGVQLQQLTLQHPQAATLSAACEAIGVAPHVAITAAMRPSSPHNSPHRGAPSPCRHSFPRKLPHERPHRPIPLAAHPGRHRSRRPGGVPRLCRHAPVPLGPAQPAPGHRLLAQAREPHARGCVQDPRRPDLL